MTPKTLEKTLLGIRKRGQTKGKIVLVYGNFLVVHPGHIRLLKFAKDCGDHLVVGVIADNKKNGLPPAADRLETVKSLGLIDDAFSFSCSVDELIKSLKPDVVVKGKEFENASNPEQELIEAQGGKLLFSSGESNYSSLGDWRESKKKAELQLQLPLDYIDRHKIQLKNLPKIISSFSGKNILVIGDLIVDEYIQCEALGMSREDPTIVVSPLRQDHFLGGAGIVAAHAKGLGANVHYLTVTGEDQTANFAAQKLKDYQVKVKIFQDSSRPTTLKQRFRTGNKTLLRVSHLRQHEIDHQIQDEILKTFRSLIKHTDLLIFSDFNYGCLPQSLVSQLIDIAKNRGVMMVADSQTSSQTGDIGRFHHMNLITPTEVEARVSLKDERSGLAVLADKFLKQSHVNSVFITLGGEGLLIHAPGASSDAYITDQLPALNLIPQDVSGAGDSLLVTASLSLLSGADVWTAAYLGSVAAALQVSSIGNTPLSSRKLLDALSK